MLDCVGAAASTQPSRANGMRPREGRRESIQELRKEARRRSAHSFDRHLNPDWTLSASEMICGFRRSVRPGREWSADAMQCIILPLRRKAGPFCLNERLPRSVCRKCMWLSGDRFEFNPRERCCVPALCGHVRLETKLTRHDRTTGVNLTDCHAPDGKTSPTRKLGS
jgi:hypothetical protein